MKFDDLPQNYKDNIESMIDNCVGNDYPDIATAFKAQIAQILSECQISEVDKLDMFDYSTHFNWFMDGWLAREALNNRQGVLI
jgi:hypothetical protein